MPKKMYIILHISFVEQRIISLRLFFLFYECLYRFSHVLYLMHPEVGQMKGGATTTVAGLFVPCSIEPFINYGERAGVVCARANRGEEERKWYT